MENSKCNKRSVEMESIQETLSIEVGRLENLGRLSTMLASAIKLNALAKEDADGLPLLHEAEGWEDCKDLLETKFNGEAMLPWAALGESIADELDQAKQIIRITIDNLSLWKEEQRISA